MQIQPLNIYSYKISHKNSPQPKHQYTVSCDHKALPMGFYVPFFGNNKRTNKNIELTESQKIELEQLRKIPDFNDIETAMSKEEIKKLATLSYTYKGYLANILKGNYIATFPKGESRPIFDLAEIAKYNKKHPDSPKNLYREIIENKLVMKFLNFVKEEDLLPFDGATIRINTEIQKGKKQSEYANQFETIIEYKDQELYDSIFKTDEAVAKLSERTINKLYKAPTPPAAVALIKDKKFESELKAKLIELLDIPYFPAAIANLDKKELEDLTTYINDEDPLISMALKREAYITDRENNIKKPLFDLENLAKYNAAHPKNQKYLTNELMANKLLTNILNEVYSQQPCPIAFIMNCFHPSAVNPFYPEEELSYNEALFDLNRRPKSQYPYIITFNKDLNTVVEFDDFSKPDTPKTKAKLLPTPAVISEAFTSNQLTKEEKLSLYRLGEIPYLYDTLQNASSEEIQELIKLHLKFQKDFEKLLDGTISIDNMRTELEEHTGNVIKIIDLESQLAKNSRNSNESSKLLNTIKNDSLGLDILEQVQKYKRILHGEPTGITYVYEDKNNTRILVNYNYKGFEKSYEKIIPTNTVPIKIQEELVDLKKCPLIIHLEPVEDFYE